MSKWTPGPWEANAASEVYPAGMPGEGLYSNAIALCDAYKRPLEECQANASLIAAAPEMVELCRFILSPNLNPSGGAHCGHSEHLAQARNIASALLQRIEGGER